jgi:hypothetical protein
MNPGRLLDFAWHQPARVVRVPGPHAIGGVHRGVSLTNHWERLGVSSLGVMEAFARSCPDTPEAARVGQRLAEKVFLSWRRLPRGFPPEFKTRELDIWQRLYQDRDWRSLGRRFSQILAPALDLVAAARLLGRLQRQPHNKVPTMDDASFRQLLSALPPP